MIIGGIELTGLLAEKLDISGGVIGWVAGLDLNNVGFVIVGLFVLTWVVALAFWRFGRVEEKWSLAPGPAAVPVAAAEE